MMEIKRHLQSMSDYIQSTFGSFILLSYRVFYAIGNMH